MGETPMCPVEVMRNAMYAQCPLSLTRAVSASQLDDAIRAALRALAEMESELVIEEGADIISEGLAQSDKDRPFVTGTAKSAWKAMCLVAASEGENS